MPLLEFQCEECERTFEELVQNPLRIEGISCGECGSRRVVRLFSAFAPRSSSSSSGSSEAGSPRRRESSWSGGGGCGPSCGCH